VISNNDFSYWWNNTCPSPVFKNSRLMFITLITHFKIWRIPFTFHYWFLMLSSTFIVTSNFFIVKEVSCSFLFPNAIKWYGNMTLVGLGQILEDPLTRSNDTIFSNFETKLNIYYGNNIPQISWVIHSLTFMKFRFKIVGDTRSCIFLELKETCIKHSNLDK